MSNILLVTPSNVIKTEFQNWSTPHLGVWRLAGYLEKHGHSVSVWDTILDDSPLSGDWDIVGFSLTHDTLPDDLVLMNQMAKQFPSAIIVAGGVEASANWQQVFEKVSRLSYVIIAEGEKALLTLANRDKFPDTVPRIPSSISKNHGEITLEEFTEFNFSIPFSKMRYNKHWNIVKLLKPNVSKEELYCIRLNTSTFCNRACRFCSITHIHKMASGHVCKPITMTGEDTKELVRKVKREIPETRTIYFHDDSYTFSKEKVETFFDNPPKLQYHIQARTDEVNYDLLKHISQGGCKRISFGVENCSPHILKDIGKGINIEEVDQVVEWCFQVGIDPIILIILFCPTSTMDDMVLNYKKLLEWQKRGIILSIMSYIRPYHGSWYFNSGLHDIEWEKVKGLKRPRAIIPDDYDVRGIWFEFEKRVAEKESKIKDHWKGKMSITMLDILGDLLRERGAI